MLYLICVTGASRNALRSISLHGKGKKAAIRTCRQIQATIQVERAAAPVLKCCSIWTAYS